MNVFPLLLLVPCLLPALPLKRFRTIPPLKKLPRPIPEIILVLAGSAGLAAAGMPWLALAVALGLAASLSSSDAVTRLHAHLRGEARTLPADITRVIAQRQRALWIARIAIAVLAASSLLCMVFGIDVTAAALGAVTLTAILSTWLGISIVQRRRALSDRIHAAELERLFAWADKGQVTSLIHVPDGEDATLKAIDALLKELASEGVKAAILCRGRTAFGKMRAKHENAWLVRTIADLDDYAVPPFRRCFHVNRGSNACHIVSLLNMRHVMVDLPGILSGMHALPKTFRMYDEVRVGAGIGLELRADASRYGITLQQKASVKPPMVMPSVPVGPAPCFGIVIPSDATGQVDLASLTGAFEVINAIFRTYGNGYRLLLAFEAAPAAVAKTVTGWLTPSLGAVMKQVKTPADVLNSAATLIWTPALDRLLPSDAKRAIIRHSEDLESVSFPAPVPSPLAGETTCLTA